MSLASTVILTPPVSINGGAYIDKRATGVLLFDEGLCMRRSLRSLDQQLQQLSSGGLYGATLRDQHLSLLTGCCYTKH